MYDVEFTDEVPIQMKFKHNSFSLGSNLALSSYHISYFTKTCV